MLQVIYHDPASLKSKLQGNAWFNTQSTDYKEQIYSISKSGKDLRDVEVEVLKLLDEYTDDQLVVLAGNSIHMDRKFIDYHLAQVASRLHYRMLDVSAFKIYFESKF